MKPYDHIARNDAATFFPIHAGWQYRRYAAAHMKQIRKAMKHTFITAVLACASFAFAPAVGQAEQTQSTERVGVYDSRAIAYAHFWSATNQQKIKALVKEAHEAKAAGKLDRFKEIEATMKSEQERNHLQVFSTAPVDEILAAMPERVVAIQNEAGVARLVSKWDEESLKPVKPAHRVDVTDLLLAEFKLNDKQARIVANLRTKKPLPVKEAEKLMREGKL